MRSDPTPDGFTRVTIGRFEFDIGRDPTHLGKMLYLHYASAPLFRQFVDQVDHYRHFKSVESFKAFITPRIVKYLRQALREIEACK